MIPFVDLKSQYLSIKNEIDQTVLDALNTTDFIGGGSVKKFENDFKNKLEISHCVSVANGTDSIYIILKALGIGPGDEVITVCNSWISSSEVISLTGARVVFVDIDPVSYTISIEDLKSKITSKTKAIIPVHLYGQACDLDSIIEIGKLYSLFIIEDCAQSHFTKYKGKNVGTFGVASSFSFYPGKNLGAYGDAGCIVTNDEDLAIKCKMIANHGSLVKHAHNIEGLNSRLDAIQARILSVKLKYISDWTELRISKAQYYSDKLKNIGDLILPQISENCVHSFHLYVLQTNYRDELFQYLNDNNVQVAIHYPKLLPFLTAYSYLNCKEGDFPFAEKFSKKIISIPLFPELTQESQDIIITLINNFFSSKKI
jgi:dTDP-4-amino-4,6-dideoxygalactose transaminase